RHDQQGGEKGQGGQGGLADHGRDLRSGRAVERTRTPGGVGAARAPWAQRLNLRSASASRRPAMPPRPARVLTGITTSGTPHLGNYVGAIRPAIAASRAADAESFYFLADLHSLIKAQDPARTQRSTLEIAAAWLA